MSKFAIKGKGRFLSMRENQALIPELFRTPAAKQLLGVKFASKPNRVLPGLDASDKRFLSFLVNCADSLDDQFKVDVDNNGFTSENGVSRDFGALKNVSGLKAQPAGHIYHDNTVLRNENGLRDKFFSSEDLDIFHELIDVLFSKAIYKNIKVADKSSSGLPYRIFDRRSKVKNAKEVLLKADEVISALARSGNRNEILLKKFNTVCLYVQNFRVSPDSFSKQRYMPDLEYALSYGTKGQLSLLDREAPLVQWGLDGLGVKACRPRLVMGLSNDINMLFSTFYSNVENYYLSEYSFTYKHRSKEDLETKINNYLEVYPAGSVLGVDVKQFDTTVPSFLIDEFYDYISGKYVSEDFAEAMRFAYRCPTFMRDVGDGIGPGFHGHPFEDLLPSPGIRSGNRDVSTFGKLFNTFNFLATLNAMKKGRSGELEMNERIVSEHGLKVDTSRLRPLSGERFFPVLGNIGKILKGEGPVKLINNGDDSIVLIPDPAHAAEYLRMSKHLGYFKIDLEDSLRFSGFSFIIKNSTDGESQPRVKAVHDITSFLVNTFVPERGYDSKFRMFWPIGLKDRYKIYDDNPAFYGVLEVVDKEFFRYKKTTFRAYSEFLLRENYHLLNSIDSQVGSNLSNQELLFLEDPNVIHYKVDPSDIRSELLDLQFGNIELEDYEHLIGKHLLMQGEI